MPIHEKSRDALTYILLFTCTRRDIGLAGLIISIILNKTDVTTLDRRWTK